ncbi:MAG: DUF3556 domain-containing protein [Sandaracinaceae bacterium]
MGLIDPSPLPYDPLEWLKRPLSERGRMVCEAWARDGYGTPTAVHFAYLIKIGLYVAGWVLACSFSPSLGGPFDIASWWLNPLAFQKAIVFSLLFEVLGLGCGSGPLTGRYLPPVGGVLYWLRPGTTKRPLFAGVPVIGARTRSWLDVSLYAGLMVASVYALVSPTLGVAQLLPLAILVPVLGVLDRTLFLAARSEHYWVSLVVFLLADPWIAGAQAVQLALWFFAGFSKLNHHFPSVVCVMVSNGPLTRFGWMRRAMYRHFPDDLRPSRLATWLAHGGTALEMAVPVAFLFTPLGDVPYVALGLMLALHLYILSSVPAGVPLEWNVLVVYGGFALFFAHPDIGLSALVASSSLGSWGALAFVAFAAVVVPIVGNLFPTRVSFLLAMRYYAGNWPYGVWLFRGDARAKLDRLVTSAPWMETQLAPFYDRATAVGLIGKVMGFRLMHLHGRALARLIPKTVDRLRDYEWVDGELIGGFVLGWNFGDGHLHNEGLLEAVQAQCGFEPGELRCVFVEPQPMFQGTQRYRIRDAATGLLEQGELSVAELRATQPWSALSDR